MNNKISLYIYTYGHFVADFASIYIILSAHGLCTNGALMLLLYNFCAFVLQMPLGLLADKTNGYEGYAAAGLIVISASVFIAPYTLICGFLCGLGNALYHIGAGGYVLHQNRGYTAAGIFVSSGALGLFLGRLVFNNKINYIIVECIIFTAILMLIILILKSKPLQKTPFKISINTSSAIAIVCIFIATFLRSYTGFALTPKLTTQLWLAVMALGITLGKALGGIFSDKFSHWMTAVVSLFLSAIFYTQSHIGFCAVLSFLLFNMTMPITLGALCDILKGAKAFAFGILTTALFLGFLPTYLGVSIAINNTFQFVSICVLTIILITRGLLDAD